MTESKKTLDRQKPYGTVHGDDEGRCFIQNGVYYDINGRECPPLVDDAPAESEAAPAKAKKK